MKNAKHTPGPWKKQSANPKGNNTMIRDIITGSLVWIAVMAGIAGCDFAQEIAKQEDNYTVDSYVDMTDYTGDWSDESVEEWEDHIAGRIKP